MLSVLLINSFGCKIGQVKKKTANSDGVKQVSCKSDRAQSGRAFVEDG
jgi:hypothetical protein